MNTIAADLERALSRCAYSSGHPRAPEPARKILHRGPWKHVRLFASRKAESHIHCESRLEYDCCFHLEADPQVRAFVSQPATIPVVLDGENHQYTPDFVVEMADGGLTVIEVKPHSKAQKLSFDHIAATFRQQGIRFVVRTDLDIHRQPRFANVQALCVYRIDELPVRLMFVIRDALQSLRPRTVGDLAEAVGLSQMQAFLAIRDGVLKVDLDQPLSFNSEILEG